MHDTGHDMRHHLKAIDGMLGQEKYDAVRAYVKSLENAMLACEEMQPEEKRFIDVSIYPQYHNLIFKFKNSCNKDIIVKDQEILSDRGEGHGQGLKNLVQVAKLYHGYCNYECQNHVFKLDLVLNIYQNPGKIQS